MKDLLVVLAVLGACGDNIVPPEPGAAEVLDIDFSPLALAPAFSPEIHDYTVRCDATGSAVTLTITDTDGSTSTHLVLAEDELVVIRDQYHVRCLPHDFPMLAVTEHPENGAPTPGWYLVNSKAFAMVLDTHGTPVWYRRGPHMIDVSSWRPNTITFMPNADPGPYSVSTSPEYETLDLATKAVASVRAAHGPTDIHELQLLPSGESLILSYAIQNHVDLTGLGSFGTDETIANCELQVLDSAGNLVWSWLGTDHVDPVTESLEPGIDMINGVRTIEPFHCNSVDVDASGNFLLSMRHANALLYIDRTTGKVQWKLGGAPVNKDGAAILTIEGDPEGTFSMEHDARLQPDGHVTMFDNHCAPGASGVARGVEYALDIAGGRGTFVGQLTGIAPSLYEGSYRVYADGHRVISWGAVANDARVVTEYDATGKIVLEITMPGEISYRAIKVPPSQLDADLLRAAVID